MHLTTVSLTSIDHLQIEGAYISGLRAANFIFLLCVSMQPLDLVLHIMLCA